METGIKNITKTEIELRNKLIVAASICEIDQTIINNINYLLSYRASISKSLLDSDEINYERNKEVFIYYNNMIKDLLAL